MANHDNMFLYHICRKADIGDLSVGYVGVSNNPSYRWSQHKRSGNKSVTSAYNSFDDITEYVVCKGSKVEILKMESLLRPKANIGWNIAKGGGVPPENSFRGQLHSDETKKKISKNRKGKNTGESHHRHNNPMTKSHREKMSQAKLGLRFKRAIVICPHCGKSGGTNLMLRYHFKNCKHVLTPIGFFDNISEAIDATGYAEKSIRTWCSSKSRPEWSFTERQQTNEENVEVDEDES